MGVRGLFGATVNLQDHIIRILADEPLDFNALREAVNNVSDPKHPWSEEWFAAQVELLVWRGQIVKHGEKYSLPENPAA